MEQRLGRLSRLVKRALVTVAIGLSLTAFDAWSQDNAAQPNDRDGLILNDPRAFQGYTLFSPNNSSNRSAGATVHRKRTALSLPFQNLCRSPGVTATTSPSIATSVSRPALIESSPSSTSNVSD